MNRSMVMKSVGCILLAFVLSLALYQTGWSQYPTKPINLIVGWGAGGVTDTTIRAICTPASKNLGQPIVVINKPGSGTGISLSILKNEKPDGYGIGNFTTAGIATQHVLEVPYDATQDFEPIMRYGYYSFGVVVRADAPWKTLRSLSNIAKLTRGRLNTPPFRQAVHIGLWSILLWRKGLSGLIFLIKVDMRCRWPFLEDMQMFNLALLNGNLM